MKKTSIILAIFLIVITANNLFAHKPHVVTSMSSLEEITRDIGGDLFKISNIGPCDQDLHFVIVKPSHIQLLIDADLIVHTGLLGEPWLAALLEAASSRNLFPGNPGDCDTSVNIKVLEKPESITREMGDVHPGGNPHFWLDPVNIIIAGSNVRDKLITLLPAKAAEIKQNFEKFAGSWKTKTLEWANRLSALGEVNVIDYHVSWSYLYERFKINKLIAIEPKPGIKPSGAHLAKVVATGKQGNVDLLLAEPFFPQRDIEMVARELGVPKLIIQQTPGGKYPRMEDIFETIVSFMEKVKKDQKK